MTQHLVIKPLNILIFGGVEAVQIKIPHTIYTMANASNKVVGWIKNAAKESWKFLSSWIFIKNFLMVSAVVVALVLLSFWWLKCYTDHGDSLQVADYVGMPLEEVVAKAKAKSFEIVVNDSVFQVGAKPHTVLEQNPLAFSRVKKNRKIYLRVTKRTPDLVKLPDLTGGNDDFKAYSRKLSRRGVKAKILERKFNNKLEENTILEVIYKGKKVTEQLKEGIKVEMGGLVEFIVTERGGGIVQIPDLACKQFDAASFLIGNYNLNVGSVIPDATVTDKYTAYVWRQIPRFSPSGTMRIGEQIDLYLTQYKPDDCSGSRSNIESPDLDDKPVKKSEKDIRKPTAPKKSPEDEDEEF